MFSRWLLWTLDRLPQQPLTMTQELVGSLLGVRRESITEAAGRLQSLGSIRYRRGHIEVVSRDGLQTRACECYLAVKKEMQRLLPPPWAHAGAAPDEPSAESQSMPATSLTLCQ